MEDEKDLPESGDQRTNQRTTRNGSIDFDDHSGIHNVVKPVSRAVEGLFGAIGTFINKDRLNETKLNNLEQKLQYADLAVGDLKIFREIMASAELIRSILREGAGKVDPSLFGLMLGVFAEYVKKIKPAWASIDDLGEIEDAILSYKMAYDAGLYDEMAAIGCSIINELESSANAFIYHAGRDAEI